MSGFNHFSTGAMNREEFSADPALVDPVKMTSIQTSTGSQAREIAILRRTAR
jgi:hypothetical protein